MKNTTTLIKTTLIAGIVAFAMTATKADGTPTFEKISFDAPIFSAEDPLGVSAITKAQGDITTIQTEVATVSNEVETAKSNAAIAQETATQAQTKATNLETTFGEFKETVTNTISTTTVDGKKKSQLTADTVVIGNVKDGETDYIMKTDTNSIVFAVNRDIEDIDVQDGSITFDADAIKFPGINTVWFGSSTLASILDGAGQGEVNVITTIKTNGVALAVDAERAVDIIIPSAGEGNIIEGITVNGASVSPDANKIVALTIPDAGQSNVIEGVTVNGTALTPDANKVVAITIPDAGQSNVIETVKVNGSALTPDSDKAVDITIPTIDGKLDATNGVAFSDLKVYPMPSGTVGQTHTIITHESISIGNVEYKEDGISYNGESYEFSSDTNGIARLKDVSIVTNGIPESISTISTRQATISAAALVAIDGINNA